MLTDVQIRECFHVLVLRDLAPALGSGLRLKGGVNSRLFFGSERYSVDMDLDADARLRLRLRESIPAIVNAPPMRRQLLRLGIPDILMNQRPAKDTETTLRYKFRLVSGGVHHPTRIEISYRQSNADRATLATPAQDVTAAYLEEGVAFPEISHYGRQEAITQKISALGGRRTVQARDVFDLGLLLSPTLDEGHGEIDLEQVRRRVQDATLEEALRRTWAITRDEFREQVATYLDPDVRARHTDIWEATQLDVASFLERIRSCPPASDEERDAVQRC